MFVTYRASFNIDSQLKWDQSIDTGDSLEASSGNYIKHNGWSRSISNFHLLYIWIMILHHIVMLLWESNGQDRRIVRGTCHWGLYIVACTTGWPVKAVIRHVPGCWTIVRKITMSWPRAPEQTASYTRLFDTCTYVSSIAMWYSRAWTSSTCVLSYWILC